MKQHIAKLAFVIVFFTFLAYIAKHPLQKPAPSYFLQHVVVSFKMIPENKKDLRARLLSEFGIFTGEAKPNTVRLLPMLNISKLEMDELLNALRKLA